MNNKLVLLTEKFIAKAVMINLVAKRDQVYLRNHYYALLCINYTDISFQAINNDNELDNTTLSDLAIEIFNHLDGNLIELLGETKEQIITRLIDELLPLPSTIEFKFNKLIISEGLEAAIKWYYQFSKDTDYIKTKQIAKNQSWGSKTKYGNIEITINLSKPEKDPHEIAREKQAKSDKRNQYPNCLLCIENEGYAGGKNQPTRYNHRMLKLNLNNEEWYFQYSPYLYYPEHSIIINKTHQDMVINSKTFRNFFAFLHEFPHYIIGSNSDIPIVGGSILTHDHYQAGNYVFPVESATTKFTHKLSNFPNVTLNYLHWPISTLVLIGCENDLLKLAELITNRWYNYTNSTLEIVPSSGSNIRHNAITPILRRIDHDQYKMYIMLRNNRMTAKYPEGIFHPHQELHHIKKENIGLIEAMGLAILPGRLARELLEIENLLLLNDSNLAVTELLFDETLVKHELWVKELYKKYAVFDPSNIKDILKEEVALKFCLVLEDSGVFKHNKEGDAGLLEFLATLN